MSHHDTDESKTARDYRETLFLPKTDFPMRAKLAEREPEILRHWREIDLFARRREAAQGREPFTLHDGPPYANGNIHVGSALNKILKDMAVRSHHCLGFDATYVPGWDCHGLPIEWEVEAHYRAKGMNKENVPIDDFRKSCRDFATGWVDTQREQFKRLGVLGDWDNPYLTMNFAAEARIAEELMKFAVSGQLYRGSKPVMWSVVEKTVLAEAEVEYHDHVSDTVWVKFPLCDRAEDRHAPSILIWTTTPWTLPGNRAIAYSSRISYGLYEVTKAASDHWAGTGDRFIIADRLAASVMKQARVEAYTRRGDVSSDRLGEACCRHPLRELGYEFTVPLLDGDHVGDEDGTGFVHTAPGHGMEDFDLWIANKSALERRGIDTTIPHSVDADGFLTIDAPGLTGTCVLTAQGETGNANEAVIEALLKAGMLVARNRLKHAYPHSWRSRKPVIFRNTRQWFIAMDRDLAAPGDTLRARALKAIDETQFVPRAGRMRLRGMIERGPDWVLSRQRAWGVPMTVFVHGKTGEILKNDAVNARIVEAFKAEGADAWFAEGAASRFLREEYDPKLWRKVNDILDVWFESGCTHVFVLEQRPELHWPADVYLEGSDQHRGWFRSSLLESCATRARAPYNTVITHGFTMAEDGRKMSKSLGNQIVPKDVIERYGADILRLWVACCDYTEDQRIGAEILKTTSQSYRRLRNTMRFLLGNLAHFDGDSRVETEDMPELERYILHKLSVLDEQVRKGYEAFDFRRVFTKLFTFCTVDLSTFYFDIRKDTLYCDPVSSIVRRACCTVLDTLFSRLTVWLAPILPFTMEEIWLSRFPRELSVHLRTFPDCPPGWRDDALAVKWEKILKIRQVVTAALEIERAAGRIGSSLEAAPEIYLHDRDLYEAVKDIDFAEIAIASQAQLINGEVPTGAYRSGDIAVMVKMAQGRKCARSWKILPEVGCDAEFPDLTPRDAAAMREWLSRRKTRETAA